MTKTWWHLAGARRIPTEYEIVSSRLLYHPERGFEVQTPVQAWYERHTRGSKLGPGDWERFSDPRQTTYRSYVALQRDQETFLDGLLETIDGTDHDRNLPPSWLEALERIFAPLRYPIHGLMMAAAYVGQMAPSGKIVIASLFQAGDEMRRVHRLAWRLGILRQSHPGLGDASRRTWEQDPVWQPLRRAVERLLVTYDWGEAFTALDLVLKPVFDELFMAQFGAAASRAGDPVLEKIFRSFDADCRWHRSWSAALAATATLLDAGNAAAIGEWVRRWRPVALDAAAGLRPAFEAILPPGGAAGFDAGLAAAVARLDGLLEPAGAGP